MTNPEISDLFTYHPPRDDADVSLHEHVRETIGAATKAIAERLPQSRERALFITTMQQAAMWANAALALHRSEPPAQ